MANQRRTHEDLQTTVLNSSLVAGGIGVANSGGFSLEAAEQTLSLLTSGDGTPVELEQLTGS